MLVPLLVAIVHAPRTIDIANGAIVSSPGGDYRYWNQEDACLDSHDPDANLGGQASLDGGPAQTVLIQFGDLERALGPNAHIVSAKIRLTETSQQTPPLAEVRQVALPWNEGPELTVSDLVRASLAAQAQVKGGKGSKGGKVAGSTPNLAVTWNDRVTCGSNVAWSKPGALGNEDSKAVSGTKLVQTGPQECEIDGLEPIVQAWAGRWYENHGLALRFETPVEFKSGKAIDGRPVLEVQVENGASTTGPDLSVTQIEVSPDVPARDASTTYTAHIKNVGTAPATGFSAEWSFLGRPLGQKDVSTTLNPGQEITVVGQVERWPYGADRRLGVVGFRIRPKGPDACAANDYLEFAPNAVPIDVKVIKGWMGDATTFVGSSAFEDWIQAQFRIWNDTYLARSRFSFAPGGSLLRTRIGSISYGDSGSPATGRPTIAFWMGDDAFRNPLGCSLPLLRAMSAQLGLMDLSHAQPRTASGRVASDPFPGLLNGGDTRFDGGLAPASWLPFDPSSAPDVHDYRIDASDLYSATDMTELNAIAVGKLPNEIPMPKFVVLRALDRSGNPLCNVDLKVYRAENGQVSEATPFATATTSARGVANLPARAAGAADLPTDCYMFVATSNGVRATAWLKGWELADSIQRLNLAVVVDLTFDIPSEPLDADTDLAAHHTVSDSANDLPAKLQPLVEGGAPVELPTEKGGWIEVDLGRDRIVGEIDLTGDCWSKFDFVLYETGQKASEGFAWAGEGNWPWSVSARGVAAKDGSTFVPYRGRALLARYVRIVNRSGGGGKLAKLSVFGIKR